MTQFIGAALATGVIRRDDRRLVANEYQGEGEGEGEGVDPLGVQDYVTGYWPGACGLLAIGQDTSLMEAQWFMRPNVTTGADSRLGYQGITRDVNNSPLLGATVKIFRTSTDEKVSPDIVSDALSGEYVISTPYYEPHWLKVEKTGSPPVQGVSVNTIYPNV